MEENVFLRTIEKTITCDVVPKEPQFSPYGYQSWKYDPYKIKERLDKVKRRLTRAKEMGFEFDGLVVKGTSGIWLAAHLILDGYYVIMVRKEGEDTHGERIEGPYTEKQLNRLIFLDDLVSSGNTLRSTQRLLQKNPSTSDSEIVGAILYDDDRDKFCQSDLTHIKILL